MSRRVVATLVVAALLAAACADDDSATAPPLVTSTTGAASAPGGTGATSAPSSAPSTEAGTATTLAADPTAPAVLDQVDCPSAVARGDGVELACGVARVALDPADPAAGTTEVTVATMAGTDPDGTTPLAVLQGGPGGASTELASWFPRRPFTQVFVDQRGTGFTGPDLDCPEISDVLGTVLGLPSEEGSDVAVAAYADCAERLRDDPLLDHVDSTSHAADVNAVMTALGYDQWVVYGVSYGSTVALELMRDRPSGMAGAVLDGVYPPELDVDAGLVFSAERAVDRVDADCGADVACRGVLADGSVRSTLDRVIAELDEEPLIVSVRGREIGLDQPVDVVMDGSRVAELVFLTLYQESLVRHLPAVLGGLDDRDPDAARWLAVTGARLQVGSQAANDEGTYFAVQCRDRLPFTAGPGDDLDPFPAVVAALSLADVCAPWDQPPAPPSAAEPVRSDVPTLVLSGEFDPITPADYGRDVAARLERATVVEQAGRGHGIWYGDDCIASIVEAFVADPGRAPDTACATVGVPVEWAAP